VTHDSDHPRPGLKQILDLAADGPDRTVDPVEDLARARHALAARRRRRFRGSAAVATMAVIATLGVASLVKDDAAPPPAPEASEPALGGVDLVAARFDAAPYAFDLTPNGWSVQGQTREAVTIAPDDGSTSAEPLDFSGKLVILFDTNPLTGRPVEQAGRRFWVHEEATNDGGYTVVSTPTGAGEPVGVVRIQYPDGAGWDLDSMVRFLGSVHVGPQARPGRG